MNSAQRTLCSQRGMTLVELMIVVAIVGILGSIATLAFNNQVKQAKVTQLESYVLKAQVMLESSPTWPVPGATSTTSCIDDTMDPQATGNTFGDEWRHREFPLERLPPNTTICVTRGVANAACTANFPDTCPTLSAQLKIDNPWYIIEIERDLNSGDAKNTLLISHNKQTAPITLYPGQ